MANPEHVDFLNKGVEEWDRWRRANLELRPDLSGAELLGRDLFGMDFYYADLSGAQLTGADLGWTRLSSADLSGAYLAMANLSGAILSGTDFWCSYMDYTILGNLNLGAALGLDTVRHGGPSTIGIDTLYKSRGKIHEAFPRGCGVPDSLIGDVSALLAWAQVPQLLH